MKLKPLPTKKLQVNKPPCMIWGCLYFKLKGNYKINAIYLKPCHAVYAKEFRAK